MTPSGVNDAGEESSPASAGGDMTQGYCIEISVLPDGSFKVSGPSALEADAVEDEGQPAGSEAGEDFDSIGAALKGVLSIIQANPVGDDGAKQLEAGYGAG